jgi:hypothetical protein
LLRLRSAGDRTAAQDPEQNHSANVNGHVTCSAQATWQQVGLNVHLIPAFVTTAIAIERTVRRKCLLSEAV